MNEREDEIEFLLAEQNFLEQRLQAVNGRLNLLLGATVVRGHLRLVYSGDGES